MIDDNPVINNLLCNVGYTDINFNSIFKWKKYIYDNFTKTSIFIKIDGVNYLLSIRIIDSSVIVFNGYWDNDNLRGYIYHNSNLHLNIFFNPTQNIKVIPYSLVSSLNDDIFKDTLPITMIEQVESRSFEILKELITNKDNYNLPYDTITLKSIKIANSFVKNMSDYKKLFDV